MTINKFEIINQMIYNILSELKYEVHYISPTDTTKFPYLAYSYEEIEDHLFSLKIESWIDNIDLIGLDEMLSEVKNQIDKKIKFDKYFSYRFYYGSKTDVVEIEGSNYIGRTINFEMRII